MLSSLRWMSLKMDQKQQRGERLALPGTWSMAASFKASPDLVLPATDTSDQVSPFIVPGRDAVVCLGQRYHLKCECLSMLMAEGGRHWAQELCTISTELHSTAQQLPQCPVEKDVELLSLKPPLPHFPSHPPVIKLKFLSPPSTPGPQSLLCRDHTSRCCISFRLNLTFCQAFDKVDFGLENDP